MKKIVWFVTALCAILVVVFICVAISANYEWDREYGSHWQLADKHADLAGKSANLDKFVAALAPLKGRGLHDAVVFTQANNSFDGNYAALVSLQTRLHELQAMDVKSMEYQLAMQQITQQEWAEAGPMVGTLKGCWVRDYSVFIWRWVGFLCFLLPILAVLAGGFLLYTWEEWR